MYASYNKMVTWLQWIKNTKYSVDTLKIGEDEASSLPFSEVPPQFNLILVGWHRKCPIDRTANIIQPVDFTTCA